MLLGREAERRQVDGLLRRARAGRSGVVVFRGEPGIGKTALLDFAVSHARGMRVLRAAGAELEAGIAFAGLYSLLHPVAEHLGALPEGHAAALRAALGLGGGPAAATPDRLAVAAGTFGLLTTAAEARPLLMLIDDLHWLDPPSTDALLFAVRRLGRDAVACVCNTRPALPGLEGLPVHDLAGLAEPDVALLVKAIAGTTPVRAVAQRLHAETGGNPLALREAAAALTPQQLTGAGLPDVPGVPLEPGEAVRQRFAARLAGLHPAARVTLLVAAAAGNCPAPVVMAAAGRLGGGQTLAAAEDARLVRLSAAGVEFCHPLVRSVAYHEATPSQRRAAHRALADALAGRDRERAAWHLAAAATSTDDAAADELDAAARAAERKGATQVAAAAWERASELSETDDARVGRLVRAADAALRAADLDRADRLAATPVAGLSPEHSARLLAVRGRLDFMRGQMAAAQTVLRDAAQRAADDPPLAAELLGEAVEACIEAGLLDEAARAAELMECEAARSGGSIQFMADLESGQLAWLRGDPQKAVILLRRCIAWLEENPVLASGARRQLDAVTVWIHLGRPDLANQYADRAVELAGHARELGRLPDAHSAALACCFQTGRWQRALAHGTQALDLAQATGQAWTTCEVLVAMTSIEAAQGRDAECLAHAREADRLAAELGLRSRPLRLRCHLALLEFGHGRLDEAIARYEQVRRLAADWGVHHPWFSPLPDLIEAYARAGDPEQARVLLPEFQAQLPGEDNLLEAGRAQRLRGILSQGDFDVHFLRGIALHEQCHAPFEQARTHLCYGERLRRSRRRRDARAQLRAATEIFDLLEAVPWAERSRAELQAAGESVPDPGPIRERLTPQEMQIALLVSEGRTNAEVGRAVFLSTRTVESHLSRAYRKLGVATRTELARQLASAQPADT